MRRAAAAAALTLAACGQPPHHLARPAPAPLAADDGLRHALAAASRSRPPTPAPPAPAVRRAATRRVPPSRGVGGRVRPLAGTCGRWTALLAAYPWPVGAACRVLMCESGGNPSARNRRSSAAGLFQVLGGSLDPATNVRQAFAMFQRRGWQPWVCKP